MNVPRAPLRDEERLAALRLFRSESIGPATYRELIDHFGNAVAALEAVPDLAARGGRRIRIRTIEEAEREIDAAAAIGARFVATGESDFPRWLTNLDGAPPLLAIRGNAAILAEPVVAIVGSRNASIAGRKIAAQFAAELGRNGYTVASGLARGIDAAAHEGGIERGTAAVFAGGLDCPYPPENVELAERIVAKGGLLLSEMPMGHQPRGRDFPRRNRIISGVSLGVVIVEAAMKSGSLITARRAADQGRLVFAVPGSPLDPRSAGTNQLIKDGAKVVTEVDDIIGEIDPMLGRVDASVVNAGEDGTEAPALEAGDADRVAIVAALGPSPVEIDAIMRFTGLKPATVHLVLLELDLAGRIERHAGQRVSLVG